MTDRDLDLVLLGATGFTGGLAADYLASHAPDGLRWGIAGRDPGRLAAVRDRLVSAHPDRPGLADLELLTVDVADSRPAGSSGSLATAAGRTRVLVSTVGPYLAQGEPVVAACAEAGTDYVDLTGEPEFVDSMFVRYDAVARATGARIVHACGFDSIPSDLGVHVLHQRLREDGAGELTETRMVVTKLRGGMSGGTIDSVRVVADLARDRSTRRLLANSQALSSGAGEEPPTHRGDPSDVPVGPAARIDPSLQGSVGPFIMASFNTRIVRRSNFLLGGGYGERFRYGEALATGRRPVVSRIVAGGMAGGLGLFLGAMSLTPTRRLLDRVLPKPGEGPSESARENGCFETRTFTTSTSGRRYRATVAASGDPGYKATALMLGEAALTLVMDRDRLPDRCGVLTPAVAMGDALVDRLRAAGMTVRVDNLA